MTHLHCTRTAGTRKSKVSTLPFAALPHDLVSDLRLTPTDKTLAALIIKFARDKNHAWPSNRRLAAELGRSLRTVQLALGRLQAAGWIRIEPGRNPTGRCLVLAWRCANFCAPGAQGIAPLPAQPVAPEGDIVIVKGDAFKKSEFDLPERQRLEPPPITPPLLSTSVPLDDLHEESSAVPLPKPTPVRGLLMGQPETQAPAPKPETKPAPQPQAKGTQVDPIVPLTSEQARRLEELSPRTRDMILTWLATCDPVLTAEAHKLLTPAPEPKPMPQTTLGLLTQIRESPKHVVWATEALAQCFDDRKSWRGFHKVCERAWRGELSPDALVTAWREASSGKARNPGAVFNHVVKRESRQERCPGG